MISVNAKVCCALQKKQHHLTLLFGVAGNSDSCDTSTSTDSVILSSSPDDTSVLDDTFMILQRATTIVKNIYFDYYALPKVDFLKNVEGLGNEMKLRHARDMIHSIVKRHKRFSGQLAERKKCDGIKDKLSKAIYTLFLMAKVVCLQFPRIFSEMRANNMLITPIKPTSMKSH